MLKEHILKIRAITYSLSICSIIAVFAASEIKATSESDLPPLPKLPALSKQTPIAGQNPADERPLPQQSSNSQDALGFEDSGLSVDDLFAEFAEHAGEKSDESVKDDGLENDDSNNIKTSSEKTQEQELLPMPGDLASGQNVAPKIEDTPNQGAIKDNEQLANAPAILDLPEIPHESEIDQSKINRAKLPQQIAKDKAMKDLLEKSSSDPKMIDEMRKAIAKEIKPSKSDPYEDHSSDAEDQSDDKNLTKSISAQDQDKDIPKKSRSKDSLRKKRDIARSKLNKDNNKSEASAKSITANTATKKPFVDESNLSKKSYPGSATAQNESGIDRDQMIFVDNEAQVLLLDNDDVVLGKVTDKASEDLMNFDSYIVAFQKQYRSPEDIAKHDKLLDFIDQYDEIFYPDATFHSGTGQRSAFKLAIKSITIGSFNDLKVLLDNYSILQLKDSGRNSLLHAAAINDNYAAAKLLLMRGIDMRSINYRGYSPMDIARRLNDSDMVFLLNSAGF